MTRKPASITIRRNADTVLGFDCACGHTYDVPATITTGPYRNGAHAANLLDCMVRYHERSKAHKGAKS